MGIQGSGWSDVGAGESFELGHNCTYIGKLDRTLTNFYHSLNVESDL